MLKHDWGTEPHEWDDGPKHFFRDDELGILFSWHRQKEIESRQAHRGMTFLLARRVFYDPDCLLSEDRVVHGEQRWHAIGYIPEFGNIVLVVHNYVYEGFEGVHIISARQAEKWEEERYWKTDL